MTELEKLFASESGLKVKAEMSKGYCDKCGKFIQMLPGNFEDDKGPYNKGRCSGCDEIKKVRELRKLEDLDG